MKVSRKVRATQNSSSVLDSENLAGYLGLPTDNGQENVPNMVNSTKLLITNLGNDITDSDICELFSEFGSIKEVAVHYNCFGYSLGTAHVVYLEPRDAAEAARRYNGCTLDGQTMTITLEGAPNGSDLAPSLPVKMRLSYGPNHQSSEIRNPLSQSNRVPKTPKRLASGPKNLKSTGAAAGLGVSRGRGRPRGRPAVSGRGKPVGKLPTAAELDLELEEYLSQTKTNNKPNGVTSVKEDAMEQSDDDFGEVNEVKFRPTAGTKTPARLVRPKKKTPGKTPSRRTSGKTPTRTTPGKTPSRRTPGKTPSRTTPGKTPSRKTSGKTPSTTPGKTPSITPGKTPSTTPGKTPSTTPGKTSSTTPGKTPSTTPGKTPSTTPGKTPSTTPGKTPSTPLAKTSTMTSRAATPAKTPGKSPGRPKKTSSLNTTIDEPTDAMEVTNDLDKPNPPSAVPASVKKLNPRRSGRFSRMN